MNDEEKKSEYISTDGGSQKESDRQDHSIQGNAKLKDPLAPEEESGESDE